MARRVSQTDFGVLLKGSDVVTKGLKAVAGIILQVRDSPAGFGSPYIIDFDSDLLPGIHSWPCNVTESRRLVDLTKQDNPDKWEGYAIGLEVIQANNPKLARAKGVDEYLVESLRVAFVVEPKKAAKSRKSKQKYHKTASGVTGSATHAPITDEDVPF